jgi:hypothetical protein
MHQQCGLHLAAYTCLCHTVQNNRSYKACAVLRTHVHYQAAKQHYVCKLCACTLLTMNTSTCCMRKMLLYRCTTCKAIQQHCCWCPSLSRNTIENNGKSQYFLNNALIALDTFASPSKNLPQPPTKSVSPENSAGAPSLPVTINMMCPRV